MDFSMVNFFLSMFLADALRFNPTSIVLMSDYLKLSDRHMTHLLPVLPHSRKISAQFRLK